MSEGLSEKIADKNWPSELQIILIPNLIFLDSILLQETKLIENDCHIKIYLHILEKFHLKIA